MARKRSSAISMLIAPSVVWWALALACWFGVIKCYAISRHAAEPVASAAVIGCMGVALFGGSMVLRALNKGDLRRDRCRMDRQRQESATTHGRARLADARDIRHFGLAGDNGILLGRYRENSRRGVDIWYAGENGGITIGPPGSGKATCGSILQLLTNTETIICHDPKFELYAVTARYRREVMGHEIVLLCPHHATLSAELGIVLPDTGFNPCSIVRDGPTVKDDVELLASLVLPSPGHTNPQAEFFATAGQGCFIAAALDLKYRELPLTLPGIRRWLMAPPKALEQQLTEMMQSNAFNGLLREIGGKLLNTFINAPEEFQGGLSMAQNALRIYDSWGPLGKHVSRNEFDPASIKRRPTTVYVGLPTDFGVTHAPWVNLAFSTLLETVGRDRTHSRVTVLIDELGTIGYLPNLLRSMALYRAQGIRVHGYIQQVSQIRRLYGPDGWRDLVGLCDFVQAFGVTEYETCKLLSDMSGRATVEDVSQSLRPSMLGAMSHAELSYGQSRTGQPLLLADDIRTMDSRQQLIFYKNMPPLVADKVDYRNRPDLRSAADPNPYYNIRHKR